MCGTQTLGHFFYCAQLCPVKNGSSERRHACAAVVGEEGPQGATHLVGGGCPRVVPLPHPQAWSEAATAQGGSPPAPPWL